MASWRFVCDELSKQMFVWPSFRLIFVANTGGALILFWHGEVYSGLVYTPFEDSFGAGLAVELPVGWLTQLVPLCKDIWNLSCWSFWWFWQLWLSSASLIIWLLDRLENCFLYHRNTVWVDCINMSLLIEKNWADRNSKDSVKHLS